MRQTTNDASDTFEEASHHEFRRSHIPIGRNEPRPAQPFGNELQVIKDDLVHKTGTMLTVLTISRNVVEAAHEDPTNPGHTYPVLHVRRNERLSEVFDIPAATHVDSTARAGGRGQIAITGVCLRGCNDIKI